MPGATLPCAPLPAEHNPTDSDSMSEFPYEASVTSTFAVLLGFEAGASTARDGDSELAAPVVGFHAYDRTKRDQAWADAIAQVGNRSALIEFKRSPDRLHLDPEIKKGKIERVKDLAPEHPSAVESGHLLGFGGGNPGAVRYLDLEGLRAADDPESIPSFKGLGQLARDLGWGESGVSIEVLAQYLEALSPSGVELKVTGYLVIRGAAGRLLLAGVDGSVHEVLETLQPLRRDLGRRAQERLRGTDDGGRRPGGRRL